MSSVPRGLVRDLALAAAVATALLLASWLAASHLKEVDWFPVDLHIYRDAARSTLKGSSPYDVTPGRGNFVYPPFAVLLFVPFVPMSLATTFWLWTAASVLALLAAVRITLDHAGVRDARRLGRLTLGATAAALPLYPIAANLRIGQVNILLMALVMIDLLWVRGRYRGIGVGVAAGLKLTPLIFVPYLLITRQVRAAVVATVTFAATISIGFVVLPDASARYWSGLFLDTSRMRPPGEETLGHSIRGALLRLPADGLDQLWLPISAAVGVAGVALAAWACRRGDALAGVITCAITGLLVSPVTWGFHWVWCVPMLLLVVSRAARRSRTWMSATVAILWPVFAVNLPWQTLKSSGVVRDDELWWLPLHYLYIVTGGAFLVVLAIHLRRTSSPPRQSGSEVRVATPS